MDSISKSGTLAAAGPKRREMRESASLRVLILGVDTDGNELRQTATTVDVSPSGARITGLAARPNQGDVVTLESSGAKSEFTVRWVSRNQDGTYQLGVQSVGKDRCPWSDWLKVRSSEMGERRMNKRIPCDGAALLVSASLIDPIRCTLLDISAGGCFVQSAVVAPAGDTMSGQFLVYGVRIDAMVEVCNSVPSVGMGLRWSDLGCDGPEKLDGLLLRLERRHRVEQSSMDEAALQVRKLRDRVAALRAWLEDKHLPIHPETVGQLREAQDRLEAALDSMES